MIKLTLHQSTTSKTFIFTKECIVIGEGSSEFIDVPLNGLGLHQNHIKIYVSRDCFYISNQANDPFITLNDLPFGKKKLKIHDSIQIKDCKVVIENLQIEQKLTESPAIPEPISETEVLEEQICDFPSAEKLFEEDDLEGWFPSDLSELNIEDIAKIDDHKLGLTKSSNNDGFSLEEQPPTEKKANSRKPFFSFRGLKWFALFAVLFLIVASAIGIETYLRAASKSGVEENKAAESLADIAMALTYSKVFHIIPQNHNYSEPEFIKNNLTALLPTTASANAPIDSKGLFTNTSYLFRFYSDQSLSRFLIIAQPAPSISQWLFPKDAILIDSALMDLRKISDLKTINSLLAAAKPFEGSNGRELSAAIKNLKVLSLPHLAKNSKKMEFAPPKILKYLRPGSENLIYNAPRYFLFSEPLVKKLLTYDASNHTDQSALEGEIERFSPFDNLILYAYDDLQAANKANQALFAIKKPTNFLSGYLLLSSTEEILSSRLIIDTKEALTDKLLPKNQFVDEIAEADKPSFIFPFAQPPFSKELASLRNSIQESLQPLLKQMAEAIEDTIQKNGTYLKSDFYTLLDNYQRAVTDHKKKLAALLVQIEQQHPNITPFEIYQNLRHYQLDQLAEDWMIKSKIRLSTLNNALFRQNDQTVLPPFSVK